ncbi:ABC transporter permease [Tunicatimonas pelagia]|uniref:ABC transporter permease n=1 Tax=Tunicatimonas pelagia TaxID=931531 RepID=UPI0026657BB3|nr:ABC transporter permease [Tunicatimonas pelagia]WKN41405.1 ABC transporter permease [Tunicatimonas pelagia]
MNPDPDNLPPQLTQRFLRWFLREELAEEVEGDLEEKFYQTLEEHSLARARRNYWYQVFHYLRPFAIKNLTSLHHPTQYAMFNHFVKISWRNLLKNRGYSLINIGGLGVGMAVALLIGLWIHYETNIDSFHENLDRIGIIRKHTLFNDTKDTQLFVPLPLYEVLGSDYPEIKHITRFKGGSVSLMAEERKVRQTGQYVDPDFLDMFSFPLIQGNRATALNDPKSIILTESLAKTLFGNDDPMGKIVRINNEYDAQVTGVISDIPENSFFSYITFLAPFEYNLANSYLQRYRDDWGSNVIWTFLEMNEGVSMDVFSDKISLINRENDPKSPEQKLSIQPFGEFHLYGEYENWENAGGKIAYVRLFGIIGVLVLLIACINFMNLSTARSEKRAQEVGIRKAIGSLRTQLILQFFSESVMIALLAFLLSIGLVFIGLPYLRDLGFEHITLDVSSRFLWVIGFGICLITGLIAGSYPALYLSSFQPVKILKGTFTQGRGPVVFRKVLVVFQFVISVGLIIGTLVVFHQINYAKSRSIGYNLDNLISIQGSEDIAQNFEALKQALLNTGYVEAVARTSSPMTEVYNKWSDFSWEGKDPNSRIALEALMTGWDYENAAGLTFTQGRPFSPEFSTDSNAVILNETALDIIGYDDPIGRTMTSGGREMTIVGIVEDVLMLNPFETVAPGVIMFVPDIANNVLIRIKSGVNVKEALIAIQPAFETYNPAFPFEYSFVDEEFNKKFAMESQVGKLAGVFALLTIFISALGLFGLASYVAEQRTKEIGIRKVLGASVVSLWGMLSKDFVRLVLISCFIAIPLAYYAMQHWLQQYDYRIELSWWVFTAAGLGALLLTLATVSYQTIKAALANPVKSLRSE